jgi:hypothetical protein
MTKGTKVLKEKKQVEQWGDTTMARKGNKIHKQENWL